MIQKRTLLQRNLKLYVHGFGFCMIEVVGKSHTYLKWNSVVADCLRVGLWVWLAG